MVRRLLTLCALLTLAASLQAATRYVTEAAGDPVKWEAWGTRALERAKTEKRPIFLSVAYASSFEAFRMHREAFLNGDNAELLNTYFVPVLLDRLERPEIAESYETIARSMNIEPQMPLNFVLTPSLEPFAAAGFLTPGDLNRMLVVESNRWANERDAVITEAKRNVANARTLGEKRAPAAVEPSVLDAVDAQPANAIAFSFLARTRKPAADAMKQLAASAVRDQLGGGFHRGTQYEKLLADQALLAIAYLEASQIARDPQLEQIARGILDATIRDLWQKNGAFDASQDAHNLVPAKGPEFWNGAFYVWETEQVEHLLGHETAAKVFRLFGMKSGARNRLALADPTLLTDEQVQAALVKLLDVRQKRPQPFRESTVISGLNGLMISALARAGAVLGEKTYVDVATIAAKYVTTNLWKQKSLSHSSGVPAISEDYAFLIQGLLDLFEASYDVRWLDLAVELQKRHDALFWDESFGRYATGSDVPETLRGLLVERDHDTPSVNAVAAMNLMRLSLLVPNEAWRARPAMIFQSFGTRLRELPHLASAYAASLSQPSVIVVTGDARLKATYDYVREHHQRWEPLRAIVFLPSKGAARDRVAQSLPFTRALTPDPERPIAYSCRGGECRRL